MAEPAGAGFQGQHAAARHQPAIQPQGDGGAERGLQPRERREFRQEPGQGRRLQSVHAQHHLAARAAARGLDGDRQLHAGHAKRGRAIGAQAIAAALGEELNALPRHGGGTAAGGQGDGAIAHPQATQRHVAAQFVGGGEPGQQGGGIHLAGGAITWLQPQPRRLKLQQGGGDLAAQQGRERDMQQHRIGLGRKPRPLQLHPIKPDRRQGAGAVAPAIPGQGNGLRPQPCAGIEGNALPHLAGEPGQFQRPLAQPPCQCPGGQAQRHR